jgi:D-hexose-6-phosphate mutarotase
VGLQVVDGARGHSVTVRRQGWPDAVVWNPWIEKAKATGDFGDEEYKVRAAAGNVQDQDETTTGPACMVLLIHTRAKANSKPLVTRSPATCVNPGV